MTRKPTYEELEQRVKELERKAYTLKQEDEALKESEERYRSLLDDVIDSSDVGIFILDSDFIVVWVNQALECYFGLKREEVVGKNKRQLIQEQIKYNFEDPEGFAERVLATYDNNTYVEKFGCHVLSGIKREDHWLEHWSRPIRSGLYSGGRIELYYNITERVSAETLLQESNERYRTLIHKIQAAVVVHDADTRIIACNSKAQDLLGLTEYQMLGKTTIDPDWKFLNADGERMSLKEYPVNKVLATRQPLRDFTAGIYSSNKVEQVWVLVNADPVLDYKGNIQQVIVTFMDITEHKRAEEEREKLINELQEALKEIKTLRGILPLCSFCKKIRNDKGYWEQIDVYIHKYSQADISHSVCPDCAKDHYPYLELFDD